MSWRIGSRSCRAYGRSKPGARALRRGRGQEKRPSPSCPGGWGHQGDLWASGGVLARPGCAVSRAAQRTGKSEVLFRPCGGHVCASPVKGIQGAGWRCVSASELLGVWPAAWSLSPQPALECWQLSPYMLCIMTSFLNNIHVSWKGTRPGLAGHQDAQVTFLWAAGLLGQGCLLGVF